MGATTIAPLLALLLLGIVAISLLRGGAATLLVLLMLGGIIAVVVATLLLHRSVQQRISHQFLALVDVCRDYAGGNRTVRAQVAGDDDFALLAMALNTLLDSQGLSDLEQEEEVKGQQNYQLSALQVQVERLLHEVGRLTPGSFPLEAGITADALGMLADSFAYLVEALAQVTREIHLAAVTAMQTVARVHIRAEQLGEESVEHLRELGEAAGKVEDLAVFTQQVVRNVQLGREAAEGALACVQKGKGAVYQAIEGMASVQASVQETGTAVSTLHGLSSQVAEGMHALSDIIEHLGQLVQNAHLLESFSGSQGQKTGGFAEDLGRIEERARAVYAQLDGHNQKLQQASKVAVSACAASTDEAGSSAHLVSQAGREFSALTLELGQQAHIMTQFAQEAEEKSDDASALAERMTQLVEEMARAHTRRQDAASAVQSLASLWEDLRTFVASIQLPNVPLIEEENHRELSDHSSLVDGKAR
jgi:methyl-accepting chemotaxis protein